jgi:hypothetical protein
MTSPDSSNDNRLRGSNDRHTDSAEPASLKAVVVDTGGNTEEKPEPPQNVPRPSRNWLVATAIAGLVITGAIGLRVLARSSTTPKTSPLSALPFPVSSGLSSAQSSVSRLKPEAASPTSTWSRGTLGWATDRSQMITFELNSENEVPVWTTHVRPVLSVRCLARTIEVFVVMKSAASIEPTADRHTVRIGFDDEPDKTEQWEASVDSQALFAPDGLALSYRIASAQVMRFRFTPFHAAPVEARFNVTGFDRPLESITKTCRLKHLAKG